MTKPVNAAQLSAQRVDFAFAIVKATWREDLGIIKDGKICSVKKSANIQKMFALKHLVITIKEQIFTLLLIIFTVI